MKFFNPDHVKKFLLEKKKDLVDQICVREPTIDHFTVNIIRRRSHQNQSQARNDFGHAPGLQRPAVLRCRTVQDPTRPADTHSIRPCKRNRVFRRPADGDSLVPCKGNRGFRGKTCRRPVRVLDTDFVTKRFAMTEVLSRKEYTHRIKVSTKQRPAVPGIPKKKL